MATSAEPEEVAASQHTRPSEISAGEKKLLFAIRPPENWIDMTRDEQLAWGETIVQQTIKPS
jgi:hypothetical protein